MKHHAPQEGSLTLALLASMIVGGLVLTLVATTITGTRSVRDDREYQTAINGADAAMQQAVTYLSQLPDGEPPVTACESGSPGSDCVVSLDSLGFDGQLGDGASFDWTATQLNDARWQLRGSGFVGGVERVVEADIAKQMFFTIGAFGDKAVVMRGGNDVTSYDPTHASGGSNIGSVGSNGVVSMVGGSSADIVSLFGPAVCEKAGCDTATEYKFPDVFEMEPIYDAIRAARDASCPADRQPLSGAATTTWVGGQTYCYTSISTPEFSNISLSGATSEDPVIVFVDGNIDVNHHSQVNCSPPVCMDDGTSTPDSGALQVYSLGDMVRLGNQTAYAFALAAPYAECKGSPSNAQAMIYGSMLCGDMANQGGWDFAFDERLADISMGAWQVSDWREEAPGTSSF